MRKPCYTDYIHMGFHQYVSLDVHQDDPSQEKKLVTLSALVWIFISVYP